MGVAEKSRPERGGAMMRSTRRRARGTMSHLGIAVLFLTLLAWGAPAIAAEDGPQLLDPASQPKFVTPVPNPLDPGFRFQPVGTHDGNPYFEVGAIQIQQDLGLVDPDGNPLLTTVWGYGTDQQHATYPGHTFVAHAHQPIDVRWT